jgi:hypothetical protein
VLRADTSKQPAALRLSAASVAFACIEHDVRLLDATAERAPLRENSLARQPVLLRPAQQVDLVLLIPARHQEQELPRHIPNTSWWLSVRRL